MISLRSVMVQRGKWAINGHKCRQILYDNISYLCKRTIGVLTIRSTRYLFENASLMQQHIRAVL